jgi:hypothetical protein
MQLLSSRTSETTSLKFLAQAGFGTPEKGILTFLRLSDLTFDFDYWLKKMLT